MFLIKLNSFNRLLKRKNVLSDDYRVSANIIFDETTDRGCDWQSDCISLDLTFSFQGPCCLATWRRGKFESRATRPGARWVGVGREREI
jgi:hypothetical protein